MEAVWTRVYVGAIAALFGCFCVCESSQLSLTKTLVYGPGIIARRSQLPVNYFYIQALGSDGRIFSDTANDTFEVSFEAVGRERIGRRFQLLELGRGLFLCHYRLFTNHKQLSISVTHEGSHVADSPFIVKNVMHENCACPLRTADEWLSDFKCPKSNDQINRSLQPFRNGGVNITRLYETGGEVFGPSASIIHYSIVNSKLYAQEFGGITGFKIFSDMILLSIVNKVHLPDMELLVNLGDWPLNKKSRQSPFPIFSWCGSGDAYDIIWPTWDMMKSTIMGLDRVTLSILTAQQKRATPWTDRETKAYFRGRDSNQARLDLVRLHRNETDLFDVGITNWFFFKHEEDVYGPKANHVSFYDFFKFKYQLNIDGTVAAYRLPYLLAGGSLVFKQHSDYYEHFYELLQPWVHYVPLERDVSDVREKLMWAIENDDKAQEMADNAFRFVQDNLLPEHLYCYIMRLLLEYAGLQEGDSPQVHPGMEPVQPEVPHDCSVFCQEVLAMKKSKKKRDEL